MEPEQWERKKRQRFLDGIVCFRWKGETDYVFAEKYGATQSEIRNARRRMKKTRSKESVAQLWEDHREGAIFIGRDKDRQKRRESLAQRYKSYDY